MRQILFLIVLVLCIGCKKTTNSNEQTKIVSPEEMQTLLQLDDVQLVDVRTPQEYKDGYIDNALNIDFLSSDFKEKIEKLEKEKPVIVYCRSGKRSSKCTEVLVEAGFKKIYDLEGGFTKWKQKGLKSQ
ncbi:rhodanese-like domain-containing protein [uncultured Algibacter sp.]|uniref:rhodanese-like domain-containing protein n=1 Tax=uncultured Algibacter sp. TaxID=298659 RepID=UPI0026173249|nr:rhodanese-like domain-containing protein [uncultured Algibacter sp.]